MKKIVKLLKKAENAMKPKEYSLMDGYMLSILKKCPKNKKIYICMSYSSIIG